MQKCFYHPNEMQVGLVATSLKHYMFAK